MATPREMKAKRATDTERDGRMKARRAYVATPREMDG